MPPTSLPARLPAHPSPTLRRVLSAEVHGLQPAAHDKTLFPSDHAAVKATLELTRAVALELQQGGGGSGSAPSSSRLQSSL